MSDHSHRVARRDLLLLGGGTVASVLAGCSNGLRSTVAAGLDGRTNSSGINLAFRNNRNLTGSAMGVVTGVTMDVPRSSGNASGNYASQPVHIQWVIANDTSSEQTLIPASLHGDLAGKNLSLAGQFQLASDFLFESGALSGSFGGSTVEARVASAPGESSSSVNVQGSFAGTPFALYATLAGDLTSGYVKGAVGGNPFELHAEVRAKAVEVTGKFVGPPALLGIILGSLLYFLPGGIFS